MRGPTNPKHEYANRIKDYLHGRLSKIKDQSIEHAVRQLIPWAGPDKDWIRIGEVIKFYNPKVKGF